MSLSLSAILLLSVPDMQKKPVLELPTDQSARHYVPGRTIRFAQLRIEKRVIIRVPRRRPAATVPLADIRRESVPPTYKEKKIGKCLPMNDILGVQMFGGRELDLLTRDRKRIRARLEKNCQARSFYSGFYMEKSGDGRICANRDILHSRSGSKCEIDRFRELVRD